jgi:hypothetical protein
MASRFEPIELSASLVFSPPCPWEKYALLLKGSVGSSTAVSSILGAAYNRTVSSLQTDPTPGVILAISAA